MAGKLTKHWTKVAKDILLGRTITKVGYLTSKECDKDFGLYKRPVTFTLDDGKVIIAQMDDEGNDAGAFGFGCFDPKIDEKIYEEQRHIFPII